LFLFILAITGGSKAEEYGTPVMEKYVMENNKTPSNDQFDRGIIAKLLRQMILLPKFISRIAFP